MKNQFNLIAIILLFAGSLSAQHNSNSNLWTKSKDYVEIPISISDREIKMQASINGTEGTFCWDTGAPMVVVNTESKSLKSGDQSSTDHKMKGATGNINSITRQNLESFKLSSLEANNMSVLGMPLSHIDKQLFGLIGTQIMNGFLTEFDLKNQKIIMNKLDSSGNVKDTSVLQDYEPLDILWYSHIPIVKIIINGFTFNMLLDSGCSSMMINPEHRDKLAGTYSFIENDTLRGAGKEEKLIEAYSFKKVNLAGHSFTNVRGLFETGVQNSHGSVKLDGIIGWDIFWACKLAYNMDKKTVFIKPN